MERKELAVWHYNKAKEARKIINYHKRNGDHQHPNVWKYNRIYRAHRRALKAYDNIINNSYRPKDPRVPQAARDEFDIASIRAQSMHESKKKLNEQEAIIRRRLREAKGYVVSADRKMTKDGRMVPARHIKTNRKSDDEDQDQEGKEEKKDSTTKQSGNVRFFEAVRFRNLFMEGTISCISCGKTSNSIGSRMIRDNRRSGHKCFDCVGRSFNNKMNAFKKNYGYKYRGMKALG